MYSHILYHHTKQLYDGSPLDKKVSNIIKLIHSDMTFVGSRVFFFPLDYVVRTHSGKPTIIVVLQALIVAEVDAHRAIRYAYETKNPEQTVRTILDAPIDHNLYHNYDVLFDLVRKIQHARPCLVYVDVEYTRILDMMINTFF